MSMRSPRRCARLRAPVVAALPQRHPLGPLMGLVADARGGRSAEPRCRGRAPRHRHRRPAGGRWPTAPAQRLTPPSEPRGPEAAAPDTRRRGAASGGPMPNAGSFGRQKPPSSSIPQSARLRSIAGFARIGICFIVGGCAVPDATGAGRRPDGTVEPLREPLSVRAERGAGTGAVGAGEPAQQILRPARSPRVSTTRCSTNIGCATISASTSSPTSIIPGSTICGRRAR